MEEKAQGHSLIVLRAALGIIFVTHGSQKLLGWFGGLGFDVTIRAFQTQLGIPPALTTMSILVEFFGGILLLLGLLTRLSAILIAIDMAVALDMTVALFTVHRLLSERPLPQELSIIASGRVGFEYVFALLFVAVYLAVNGAGPLSVDRIIKEKVRGGALEKLFS